MTRKQRNALRIKERTAYHLANFQNNGIKHFWCADIKLARQYGLKELRGGKIQYGEGKGREVWLYGEDELGNLVAWTKDGQVMQYWGAWYDEKRKN